MTSRAPAPTRAPDQAAASARVSIFRLMARPHIFKGALRVSAVVGTVLNFVNQGEQFWTHHTIIPWRVAMNFVVPFCVSIYSAARNQARRSQED